MIFFAIMNYIGLKSTDVFKLINSIKNGEIIWSDQSNFSR